MLKLSAFSLVSRTAAFALLATIAVGITGCGKAKVERIPVTPVAGTVQFSGKPTPGALIVFHPLSEGSKQASARGTVGEDGTFKLSTYDGEDGAAVGEYKVTIEWYKLVGKGNEVARGPNVIPAKYSRPETTDLRVAVSEGKSQLDPIVLK